MPPSFHVSTVAIDGSGSLQVDENIGVCYAAVYAYDRIWGPFCKEWWRVLESHGLDYFRTTEAMNFSGHFGDAARRWEGDREERRDQLLLTLVGLQKEHNINGVIRVDDNRFLNEKAEKVAGRKMVVFKKLIHDLLRDAPPDVRFQLLCDDEQDLAPEVYRFYTRTKVQGSEARDRLIGVAFMDDRFLPQVQLADLCAYFGRVETDRQFRRQHEPQHPVIAKLTETRGVPVNDIGVVRTEVGEDGDYESAGSGAEASSSTRPDEGRR